jgi:hypothetical protein
MITYILLSLFFINFIYKKIFINGFLKVPIGEYSIRRVKYNFDKETINDLKEIAINSVGIIPNNPFFKGVNLQNKIALVIYHKNKPVGFNVMFDYKYKKLKCLHTGLVLIDKNYKGRKLQHFAVYNIIFYLVENLFSTIYLSDLGRSASGLKIMNLHNKSSYPNLIYNTKSTDSYKQIFNYFVENFKEDTQISSIAVGDDNTFIISNSNNSQGGASYLLDLEETRKSSDSRYNDFIDKMNKEDEVLSIGIISLQSYLFC